MEAYAGVFMELEFHELEFHAIFFFFKFDHPILNFLKIEFQLKTRFLDNRVITN